ncbi:MAG: hypothetical protein AAFR83_25570, partial [Cyanobacteria bacterium J06629_18]
MSAAMQTEQVQTINNSNSMQTPTHAMNAQTEGATTGVNSGDLSKLNSIASSTSGSASGGSSLLMSDEIDAVRQLCVTQNEHKACDLLDRKEGMHQLIAELETTGPTGHRAKNHCVDLALDTDGKQPGDAEEEKIDKSAQGVHCQEEKCMDSKNRCHKTDTLMRQAVRRTALEARLALRVAQKALKLARTRSSRADNVKDRRQHRVVWTL